MVSITEENVQWLIEPFNEKARNNLYESLKNQQGDAEEFKTTEGKRIHVWRVPDYRFVRHMINRKIKDNELLFEIWRIKDYGKGNGKSLPENVTHLFLSKKRKLAKKVGRKIETRKK